VICRNDDGQSAFYSGEQQIDDLLGWLFCGEFCFFAPPTKWPALIILYNDNNGI